MAMTDIRTGSIWWRKGKDFVKFHLHITLYTYFWFGLFLCGLLAPAQRVAALESDLISRGWHLSVLSVFLILPVPVIYILRMRNRAAGLGKPGTSEQGGRMTAESGSTRSLTRPEQSNEPGAVSR